MITRLIIKNYKGIESADIEFRKGKNIIVGNNGVGKSTIVEALSLALGYGLSKFEIEQYVFNINAIKKFKETKELPEILIEVYFDDPNADFSGANNSLRITANGIRLRIIFDSEAYQSLFDAEKNQCNQIPCEFYKIDRCWFSDQPVRQLLMPYIVQIIDSSSTYFNSSSNQYLVQMLDKYIGETDEIKIRTGLRQLKDKFDALDGMIEVNNNIHNRNNDLTISLDVTSRMMYNGLITPLLRKIPVTQIGAGELCILKTFLSLDRTHTSNKQKIIIIEEPESHLSHTKMYELINLIENAVEDETQFIITTHNNFIANKLDIKNLILLNNNNYKIEAKRIEDTNQIETTRFFTKISNYPTLRMILSKKTLLLEDPTDEMVLTYYYKKRLNKLPFEDGIDVISVEGTAFKQFAELAKLFMKKVAILTDNDRKNMTALLAERGLVNLPDNIRVFTDLDIENNYTIEPSFVNHNLNKLQELSDTVRGHKKDNDTKEDLIGYMNKDENKTTWSFRLLDKIETADFEVPQYIIDSINWLNSNE